MNTEIAPIDKNIVALHINPLLTTIPTKSVLTNGEILPKDKVINSETGEIYQGFVIQLIADQKDSDQFVKMIGNPGKYLRDIGLTRTAIDVFWAGMDNYLSGKLRAAWKDTFKMIWNKKTLNGEAAPFSRRSYQLGMAELLKHQIFARKTRDEFYVNPSLVFRGDRFKYAQEMRANLLELAQKYQLPPQQIHQILHSPQSEEPPHEKLE